MALVGTLYDTGLFHTWSCNYSCNSICARGLASGRSGRIRRYGCGGIFAMVSAPTVYPKGTVVGMDTGYCPRPVYGHDWSGNSRGPSRTSDLPTAWRFG